MWCSKRLLLIAAVLLLPASPVWAAFTHVQGTHGTTQAGNAVSMTLASAPTPGNAVCVGINSYNALTISSILDGNGNSYTISHSSPVIQSGTGYAWLAYLLKAPANASATITATFSTTPAAGSLAIFADEFSYAGGLLTLDVDATAVSTTGNAVNAPSITPRSTGELFYSIAQPDGSTSSANSPWTGNAGGVAKGSLTAYDMNVSGALAVNFTSTGTVGWEAMAMAMFVCPRTELLLGAGCN